MALESLAHRPAARQAACLEHRAFEIASFGDVARHQVKLVRVALQRAHELHGIAALGEDPVERAIEACEIAVEGRGDHIVDSDRGRVAQHGHRIFQGDALAGVRPLVEQQLVDLAARLAAITAQPFNDPFQRVRIDAQALRAGSAFDQALERGLVVHVTG